MRKIIAWFWGAVSRFWSTFVYPFLAHWVYLGIIVSLLLGGYYVYYTYFKNQGVSVVTVYKTLTKIKQHTKYKYKTLYHTKIKYIPKKEYAVITKKVLPKWLASSPSSKILASGKVPPYKGTTQVVSILNTSNGKSSLAFKQLPYTLPQKPFFSLSNNFRAGVGYGVYTDKHGTRQATLLQVEDSFLRIGNIKIKAVDNLYLDSSNTANFAGMEATYRFKL